MKSQNTITIHYSNVRRINRKISGNFQIDYDNPISNEVTDSNPNGEEVTATYNAVIDGKPAQYIRTRFFGREGNSAEYEYGTILHDGVDITDQL